MGHHPGRHDRLRHPNAPTTIPPTAALPPTAAPTATAVPTPTWVSQDELHRITVKLGTCVGHDSTSVWWLRNSLKNKRMTPQEAWKIAGNACQPTPDPPPRTRTHAQNPGPTAEPRAGAARPRQQPETPAPAARPEPGRAQDTAETGWTPEVREQLTALRHHHPELAGRVETMPFLETRDLRDALAIRSLAYTSYYDPQAAAQQLQNPEIRDGIQDRHTTMVALLHAAFLFHPGLTEQILDPDTLRTRTETATLPRSGKTRITQAWLGPEPEPEPGITRDAAHALAGMEEFLDAPLPVRHVIILLGAQTPGNSGGVNTQTSITLPARYQNDRERLRHELAHYFWNDNQPWIDEGMAELFSQMAGHDFTQAPVPLASPACRSSIGELEQGGSPQCAYAVGERFFSQLRENTGHLPFREGARKLQRESRRTGRPLALDDVREIFETINPSALRTALDQWE